MYHDAIRFESIPRLNDQANIRRTPICHHNSVQIGITH